MKKLYIIFLFIISLFLIPNVYAIEELNLNSKNYVIYDMTDNNIIIEKNMNEKVSIASLTKIMTTLTAILNEEDLNRKVTIKENMFYGIKFDASMAGLKVGDEVTIKDLLYAAILPSGADATHALAISISGSINNYVDKMNELTKEIGMNNTSFKNVSGIDVENHYSTNGDILILLKYALNNPTFKEIYTTKEYTLSNGLTVTSTTKKMSELLDIDISRIKGAKTGFTNNAGLCISFIFNSNNHDYIAITTGADKVLKEAYHIKDAIKIIEYVDDNYNNQILIKKGDSINTIKVDLSKIDEYQIRCKEDVSKYLRYDFDEDLIKAQYIGKKNISYKTKKGSRLGKINYYYNNELIKSEEVILDTKISPSIIKIINKYKIIIIVFLITFITFITLFIIIKKRN